MNFPFSLPFVRGLALAALVFGGAGRAPGALPDWLVQSANLPTPAYAAGAPAVVLRDQISLSVDSKGRRTEVYRYAVRILTQSGESHATAWIPYLAERDTAKGQGAWLLRGGKEVKSRRSHDWVDVALDSESAYTEFRAKTYSYSDLALPGDVFAFEGRVQGTDLFASRLRIWKTNLPTILTSYDITLAPGWGLKACVDGERTLQESRSSDGLSWSWMLRDRPYLPEEPFAPDRDAFDARLFVALVPPGQSPASGMVSFASWADVSAWHQRLSEGQCDRDAALVETVGRVTAGVDDTLGRIRAISQYVQQLRYVSVSRDIGIGFGFRPRKATEVNAKGWGDCKDKVNLMCAMLREIGVTAYDTSAHIGLGGVIAPSWPSPLQFNHAIVAIVVDESIDLPAIVTSPRLGRVLFFDATSADTMLGDLPATLQGTRVHVLADGNDELITLPVLPFVENRCVERKVAMELAPDGSVTGSGTFSGAGQTGASLRALVRLRSTKELEEYVTSILGAALRGASVQDVKFADDPVTGAAQLQFSFSAPQFLQFLPGNLALVKLDMFTRAGVPTFSEKERRRPVRFDGLRVRETIEVRLPEGMAVEELPTAVAVSEPFGSYANQIESREGLLRFERVLDLENRVLPTSDYSQLRQFLSRTLKADRASAVLRVVAP